MKNKIYLTKEGLLDKPLILYAELKILLTLLIICVTSFAFSQAKYFDGYGSGCDGDKTLTDGVLYMDDNRAQVSNKSGSGPYTLTLNKTSGSFNVTNASNGSALLIQMIGDSIGVHQRVNITQVNSATEIEVDNITVDLQYTGSNRVQIIQVNEYQNFYLEGGKVTCHPWNGYTGGVLIMAVQDSLKLDGGYFTVSGLGYYPEGMTWGSPGTGGNGSASFGLGGNPGNGTQAGAGGGYPPCERKPCLTGNDTGMISTSNIGGYGEACSGCGGSSGSSNSGTLVTYRNSSMKSYAVMGNPGNNSGGAGDGGSGSGGGGGGGSSALGNAGLDGLPGEDGGDGGEAGQGARGGGLMYIKAGRFVINSTNKAFYSDGGVGENGGKGENGGDGGLGGFGGSGGCSGGTAAYAGGTGGGGIPGDGADGGDGANGGSAGYLWLISQTTPHGVSTSDVSVSGGQSGSGGPGGYAVGRSCRAASQFNFSGCSLDISFCTPPPVPDPCIKAASCNCDSAYSRLGRADTAMVNAPKNKYDFKLDGVLVASYDYEINHLIGYVINGCDTIRYHCPVYDSLDCDYV